MPALSSFELQAMRDVIQDELLPDTCSILSVTSTPDGMGGQTETWTAVYSNVPCRLDMQTGREQAVGGGWQPYTKYMMSLPYDTVIAAGNRISHNSVTYAVLPPNNNQSWIAVVRVELEVVNA